MTQDIDPKLVERMVALVRAMAALKSQNPDSYQIAHLGLTARDIAVELAKPVDPDLLLAREVAVEQMATSGQYVPLTTADVGAGRLDTHSFVVVALAAIKRARATP